MSALEDIEAIKQLKARYFRLMDTKQWDAWADVFTEDATVTASPDPDETFRGRAEIVRKVSAALREATTVHHGHMPEIELTSATTATGGWAMEDMLRWPDGREMHGYGHYHETYEKVGGAWRIKSSKLTRLRTDFTQASQR